MTAAGVREAVVIGLGQIGSVIARALAARGHSMVAVRRHDDIGEIAALHPSPSVVCVAVAEADLESVLEALPASWRDRTLLVQNELRPRTWEAHVLVDPTVAVIWFESKADKPLRVILSSPVAGPFAGPLVAAFDAAGIPAHEVPRERAPFELAAKNAYILTTNVAGLRVGGVVRALLAEHAALFRDVLDDVLAVEGVLFEEPLDRRAIEEKVREAIAADPEHVCTGRSAPGRLARMLGHADAHGLAVETLRSIGR